MTGKTTIFYLEQNVVFLKYHNKGNRQLNFLRQDFSHLNTHKFHHRLIFCYYYVKQQYSFSNYESFLFRLREYL